MFKIIEANMKHTKKGQTIVTLLIFIIIGITITSAAVVLIISNSIKASKLQEGMVALQIAESGAENAMLRILRDPAYTGETMPIAGGTATITVSGTNPITIVSTGRSGNNIRKIQVLASDINYILTVTSWKEIF